MKKIIIISGANRGLGKALVDYAIKDENTLVISISRNIHKDHLDLPLEKFLFIKVDFTEDFIESDFDFLKEIVPNTSKIYFINNASVILPIEEVGSLEILSIDSLMKVNLNYPVKLINFLLNIFINNNVIMVNISSGAAENPIPNWSLYCASKAFMKMFFRVIENEKDKNKFKVFNIDPGVLDTDMQIKIRNTKAPKQDYFKSLKDENKLINVEVAAKKIFKEINCKFNK